MEKDIERKIDFDFGNASLEAKKLIGDFEDKMNLSPRVSRSIVFLAGGSLDKLNLRIDFKAYKLGIFNFRTYSIIFYTLSLLYIQESVNSLQ